MAGGTGNKGEDMRQARLINRYVESLTTHGKRRGNPERLKERVALLEQSLQSDLTAVQRILHLQEHDDLVAQLEEFDDHLERDFVKIIGPWAERHGVTYATLRQMNIPAEVLRRAKVAR
jgi:hypothetical protein